MYVSEVLLLHSGVQSSFPVATFDSHSPIHSEWEREYEGGHDGLKLTFCFGFGLLIL